jgi:AcrR family transcriptional regulator
MNPKFLELTEEKRERIVNAGFRVFGRSEYRHASTEEIAATAGISKGLLFYYFEDKRSLYAYLFEQAVARIKEYVLDGELGAITDFFDYCRCAALRKCELLARNPHILNFIMRAYNSKDEAVSGDVGRRMGEEMAQIAQIHFRGIDFSKFRDDVDFKVVYRMLIWAMEGYIAEQERMGKPYTLDEMMDLYMEIASYLKRMSYKEEYLK